MKFIKILKLYFETIKYLKFKQIFYRALLYLNKVKKLENSITELRLRDAKKKWIKSPPNSESMLSKTTFFFLNKKESLNEIYRYNKRINKLWMYNFHYFDYLNSYDSFQKKDWYRELIFSWIKKYSFGTSPGWDAYTTSLRIVNWTKWYLNGNVLLQNEKKSLSLQAEYLYNKIEFHLMGNHLLANAKALIFAGSFLEGYSANKWFEKGIKLLSKECQEQILHDGGHFERSPMYHSIIYEDFLDILNLSKVYPSLFKKYEYNIKILKTLTNKMAEWLEVMTHPDGEISFFNDSAMKIAKSKNTLFKYHNQITFFKKPLLNKITFLKASGYVRVKLKNLDIIIDVAPIGPDYIPGHAHADTLSYEISLFKKRVIVNSGTSTYEYGCLREWQRSTLAHNTLEIDELNSSKVWHSFRVGNRAYPFDININEKDNKVIIRASHDGFNNILNKRIHTRTWVIKTNKIDILDEISGKFKKGLLRTYFHPDIKIDNRQNDIILKNKNIKWKTNCKEFTIKNSFWYPEFGKMLKNKCIEMKVTKYNNERGFNKFTLEWS